MATIRLQSGKWQARIQRKGFTPISKCFINKTDAIRWSRQIESDMDRGSYAARNEAESTTLQESLSRYRKEVTPHKKGIKVEGYKLGMMRRSKLAKMSLANIRSTDIAKYRDERIKVVAANTVKNELNTLSAVFECVRLEWGINITNPVRGLKRPPAPPGRNRRLYQGEQEKLIASCIKSRAWYLHCIVVLAIETGMRLGEMAGLRYTDIDLEAQTAYLHDTKNGESREIPLSTRAKAALQAMPTHISGKVFPVDVDSIKTSYSSAVKRARTAYEKESREAGIPEETINSDPMLTNLRFHDLRHEAVSRLFERGLNTIEVSTISGHKTLAMLRRYTHLRAADLVGKLG